MNEKQWFQAKIGLYTVLLMLVLNLFELRVMTFEQAFFSVSFLIKLAVMAVLGTFIFGYFEWRQIQKKRNN